MKGLAPAHTLTGQVQRLLEDDWFSQSAIMGRLGLPPRQAATVRALLERLVAEGRAQKVDGEYRATLHETPALAPGPVSHGASPHDVPPASPPGEGESSDNRKSSAAKDSPLALTLFGDERHMYEREATA